MGKAKDTTTGLRGWRDSVSEKVKWSINILGGYFQGGI